MPLETPAADNNSNGALAVDASGSAYIAGSCGDNFQTICVEKLNPLGTALVYKANVFTALRWLRAAVDGPGNLFVAQQDAGIVKLGPTGALEGASGPLNGVPVALVSDSSGAPELVLQENLEPGVLRLLRWTPDLAAVLFDKALLTGGLVNGGTGSILNIGIDSSGTTTIVGASYGANLATFHPTQPCNAATAARTVQPTAGDSAFLARFDANGALLQSTYLGIVPGFITGAPILFRGGDASVIYSVASPSGNWQILNLGPASSEIGLICVGAGATFSNAALSPNEIVSVFGNGIGPAQPVTAQPDPSGIYLSQLEGTQVTFDGQPAPILYAASGQINVVTPGSLQAKTTTHVCVRVANTSTNCLDFGVRPMAPYIFLSATPFYAAALNQDGTINSATNPAPAGSVVLVFGSGFGAVGNSIPDGGITPPAAAQYPGLQVEASWQISTFNWTTSLVTVLYAGAAPLEVEGVGQINFVVPATLGYVLSGPTFEITITSPNAKLFSPSFQIWTR